jgi:histidyl-tRNA synthetase
MNKQMQAAENARARCVLIFGAEYPQVAVKNLHNRQQELVPADALVAHVQHLLSQPAYGPLIAASEEPKA